MTFFKNFTTEKKLAAAAIILGIFSIFAGSPYHVTEKSFNAKEMMIEIKNSGEEISPLKLGEWLIEGQKRFVLLDLRTNEEYNDYFIPTAVNVPVEDLLEAEVRRNQTIVLYSGDDLTSAQAWFMLRADNYKAVYILKGGLEAWKKDVLFPKYDPKMTETEAKEFNKIAEMSKFFGGEPQAKGKDMAQDEFEMPEMDAPVQTKLKAPPKKKKREGC